jgi:hypothetical protein
MNQDLRETSDSISGQEISMLNIYLVIPESKAAIKD